MLHGVLAILTLLAVAWMLSENRRVVPWRPVLAGLALQAVIAVLVLGTDSAGTLIKPGEPNIP